jgi:enterochelin esterase-like enzyme
MPVQLTSSTFLLTCVLLAIAAPTATLLLWPRTRGVIALRAVQRLAMIALCQVTALALVAVLVNNYFFFYSSWADLFGKTQVGTISIGNALPPSAAGEARTIAAARRNPQSVRSGVVVNQTIVEKATGLTTPAVVYLPPQYFQRQYARTRFPVVLVFPGFPGNPPIYFTQLPIARIMQTEIAAGRGQPFIAVIVKETVVPPRDTECANVAQGPQVESFLALEVRRQISQVLRVRTDRAGWAMMGTSTGGYCAVKMVMRHPDLYASAVSLSGYYTALLDRTTGALYGNSTRVRNENSPLWRLQHLPAPPVSVLATISKPDHTYLQTLALIRAVKPPMLLSTIISPTGGHNLHTDSAVLPQAIDWLSHQFGAPPSGASALAATSPAAAAAAASK